MQKLLTAFQDGQGNASMMRVVVFLIVVTVIGTKFYNSYLTHMPIVWDQQDFTMLGGALGAKLFQNSQEDSTPPPTKITP